MGGEEGHCLLSWKGHFASVESTYNMKGETWWAPQYFCHAPLVSAIAVIMVRSTPQTRVAYNKQHLCLSLPRVWAPAKVPWAGTQGSSLCLSHGDRDEGAVATWSKAKSQHTSIFKASVCVTSAHRPSAKANRRSCLGRVGKSMLLF